MGRLNRRNIEEEEIINPFDQKDINLKRKWEILAKNDYSFYVEYVHRGMYQHGAHTLYICNILEKIEKGELDRVVFTLPPRHSKSMTVSETFPSWFIGKNSERRVIEVSYSDRLAKRFGRLNKQKIKEFGEDIFGISMPEWGTGTQSSTDWNVAKKNEDGAIEICRGGMISSGIGGSITGEGAHLLLIDDPIKNREEAYSLTYRNKIWEEWKNTLLTRLMPGGAVIIILTRWHEDDLVGRILNPKYYEGTEKDEDRWTIVSLPAECDIDDDLIGREKGEYLWPEYGFDKAWADKTKIDVGNRTWTSLYQQRPTALEGGLIKRHWWKEYKANNPPPFVEIIQSWDCAYEEFDNLKGSFTVCTTWGRTERNRYYLLDVYRKQIEYPELIKQMKALYSKWNPNAVIVEYKASGKSAFQALRSQTSIPLLKELPHKSKLVRLEIVSPLIEAGLVYLPDLAPWLFDYIEELATFPGQYDDQVDSTSQALKYFQTRTSRGIVTSDEYEAEEELLEEREVINIEGLILNKEALPDSLAEAEVESITREELHRAILDERYG